MRNNSKIFITWTARKLPSLPEKEEEYTVAHKFFQVTFHASISIRVGKDWERQQQADLSQNVGHEDMNP